MPRHKKAEAPPAPNFPPGHPDALALLADTMPWKTTARDFPLESYIEAIRKLRTRDYSYAEIADWLNNQLKEQLGGKKIQRGQVYRVYQQWLQAVENESWGTPMAGVREITEEEAEVQAEISDKKPKESSGDKKP